MNTFSLYELIIIINNFIITREDYLHDGTTFIL